MPERDLNRDELREVIKVALWAGQLQLQHGADSARVQETVHRISTGLGSDWIDVVVNLDSIIASSIEHGDFRTKVRYVPQRGVNMHIIASINDLSRRVNTGELSYNSLAHELRKFDHPLPQYNRWVVVVMVGLACGAFSQLFGGDGLSFLITFLAATTATLVRQELQKQFFNPYLTTAITAFVAAGIASILNNLLGNTLFEATLAASVILLVPGVPLINAAEDLLNGHTTTGIARGVAGFLVALGIALGLSLAIWLTGFTL